MHENFVFADQNLTEVRKIYGEVDIMPQVKAILLILISLLGFLGELLILNDACYIFFCILLNAERTVREAQLETSIRSFC
jgi:hypothetical protein